MLFTTEMVMIMMVINSVSSALVILAPGAAAAGTVGAVVVEEEVGVEAEVEGEAVLHLGGPISGVSCQVRYKESCSIITFLIVMFCHSFFFSFFSTAKNLELLKYIVMTEVLARIW